MREDFTQFVADKICSAFVKRLNRGTYMKLKPLGKRLVVELIEQEEPNASPLFLPETLQAKIQRGKVVVAGAGIPKGDGSRIPLDVKTGATVLFTSDVGIKIRIDNQNYIILTESEVLAMIRTEE